MMPDANSSSAARERARPNLLYIHSDQHSPQALGCYGDPLAPTPNLDRLAARGSLFRSAYCASPICVASRMAMLTGLHPCQPRVWSNDHCLNSSVPTLAHSLGAAGLSPVLSGRMHSVGPDQPRGYVARFVGDHNPNFLGGRQPGRGQLEGTAGPDFASIEISGSGQSGYQVHDEAATDAALKYLKRHAGDSPEEPFCLTVGYMLPHPPFVARGEDFSRYADRVTLPRIREPFDKVSHPFLRWWRRRGGIDERVPDELVLRCRAAYWALVDRLDAEIGRLIEYLDTSGLSDDTLVIYTSDHGEMAGERDFWWKHVFYEPSVRGPLIVSWPRQLPRGAVFDEVVSSQDVTATLLDLMDAPALPGSPGRSLRPLLANPANEPRRWENLAFSEYCNDEAFSPKGGCRQRMIRRDRWKLVHYHEQPCQLFDLENDPDELEDLAEDPRHRATIGALQDELLRDWDPEAIRLQMALQRQRIRILADWGKATQPEPVIQWPMTDGMNFLDDAAATPSPS